MYVQLDGGIHGGSVRFRYKMNGGINSAHVLIYRGWQHSQWHLLCKPTRGNGSKLFLDISLWDILVVLKRTGVLCFVWRS